MAVIEPILSSRSLLNFTLNSGSLIDGLSSPSAWPSNFVDYGNEGDETSPPSLVYANKIDQTSQSWVGILLPLSAEGVLVTTGDYLLYYRHPRFGGF